MGEETKKMLQDFLDPREISEIEMLIERPAMMEALRKVLFWPITHQGTMQPGKNYVPNRNYLLNLVASGEASRYFITDKFLGKHLRIQWEAINLVEKAFKEMASLKKEKVVDREKINKAR